VPVISLASLRSPRLAFGLATAVAVMCAAPADAATASRARLTISPAAGTPDASPKTGVSVLGVPRKAIESVVVTGGTSGAHPGRLLPFSRGRGAIFVPRHPLTQGERVQVVVRVRGRAAVRFSFAVARLGPTLPVLNPTVTQPRKLEHYVSAPRLTPPHVTVLKRSAGFADGIFLTPLPSPIVHPGSTQSVSLKLVGPGGPMIVDDRGHVVWFRQLRLPEVAANLQVQHYAGRRVLTWWQGPVTIAAFGLGEGVIADSSYRTLHTVHAGNGYRMDLHEFALTPAGDALFTIYSPVMVHLKGTPAGKLSLLMDAIVQEVEVRTGRVTWEWHALGHIPLADSYATPANSAFYDAYHFNAVQPLADNRVLVSARDTSAVYDVDRATGHIRWTLGGKASDFRLGRGARFWFQHHARLLSGRRVSVFDDEAGPPQKAPASRGLVLALDLRHHTARVVRSYRRAGNTSAQSEGSLQALPGGGEFAGFGSTGFFTQFTQAGRRVFDARLPADDGSYRVYRFPWRSAPGTRPAVAARRTGAAAVTVYASWNGATAVRRWQVLAGRTAASMKRTGSPAARTGFETRIAVPGTATTFAVRALDATGRILATSAAVPAS
jgi:Arylsulfotransferase (ASST)